MDFKNKQLLTWIHRSTSKIIMNRLHLIGLCLVDTSNPNSIMNTTFSRYYSSVHNNGELPWYSVRYYRLANHHSQLSWNFVRYNKLDNHHYELPWNSFRYYSSGHHHKKPSAHSDTHLYDVLHISPTATQSQIKNAYFKLSKLYHPDVNKSEDAVKIFHEISEAYEILGNERKRRLYDKGIVHTDLRSPHRSHEGGPEVHGHGFRRQNFIPRHKRPLTGKSHIYNFDEFYKKQYEEARNKEEYEAIKARIYRRIREDTLEKSEENKIFEIMFLVLSFVALIALFRAVMKDHHAVPKPPDKHTKKNDK